MGPSGEGVCGRAWFRRSLFVAIAMDRIETVLIVDDEWPLRELYSRQCEELGWVAYTAATQTEACDRLAATPAISVILLDYSVSECGLSEFVAKLRQLQAGVCIVGNSGECRNKEFAAVGVDGFLMKPWEVSRFVELVRR